MTSETPLICPATLPKVTYTNGAPLAGFVRGRAPGRVAETLYAGWVRTQQVFESGRDQGQKRCVADAQSVRIGWQPARTANARHGRSGCVKDQFSGLRQPNADANVLNGD